MNSILTATPMVTRAKTKSNDEKEHYHEGCGNDHIHTTMNNLGKKDVGTVMASVVLVQRGKRTRSSRKNEK